MPRPSLITLSGIDCSGKSTQVSLLAAALRRQGRPVSVVWFRPGYSSLLDSVRRTVRGVRPSLLPTSRQQGARDRAFAKPWIRDPWIAMAIADTFSQYALRVRGLMLAGRTVICDRYLPDAGLDLLLRFPERRAAVERAVSLLRLACPTPTLSVLLTLPQEEMLRRMVGKAEPFPDDQRTRELRYAAYMNMAKQPEILALDAGRSIEALHEDLITLVGQAGRSEASDAL